MAKGKRAARVEARQAANRRRSVIQTAIAAAAVLGIGAGWWFTRPPAAPPVVPERLALEHSQGPEDAQVTIVEYGDYNCPSCQRYHQLGIIDRVLDAYPGQVRFVFRHFPIITADSPRLAEAAECAADQDAFWRFHNVLYAEAPTRPGDMTVFAERLGLDVEAFTACLEGRWYADLIEAQMRDAFGFGFRGTPSFRVNGQALAGPPGYDQLVAMIEGLLETP